MTIANLTFNIDRTAVQFQRAMPSTQLVILHYLVKQLNKASKTATPSAFFSQRVQNVLRQLQQLPREERYQALQEILVGVPTRISEAYSELDVNMKMAFWYRLANSDQSSILLSGVYTQADEGTRNDLLADLESRDSNELVSFLREVVSEPTLARAC